MTMLLRCLLLVLLLSFASGCASSGEPSLKEKQPPEQPESLAKPQSVLEPNPETPDTRVIKSKGSTADPETQQLYTELDKELNDLKNVLDNLETVEEKDLNTNE